MAPKIKSLIALITLLVGLALHTAARADVSDPLDPFDRKYDPEYQDLSDDQKTSEELIDEAMVLMQSERLLDARTKLLNALKKDPKAYEAHVLLAGYYLVHVGHFRLALKYIKQAEELFKEKNGPPPYKTYTLRAEHARMLYLLSQIRLDLDNYEGALETLDEFTELGYYGTWYPGSRAWILMKMGDLDEAIRVARLGVLADAERGRTLNMLGILLSMKGEREASLKVFQDSISYEQSLGDEGQPATPLNNSGEVYKEIFKDDKAEAAWLRATSLKDGCEHVLPSLNLALLYIEQLNLIAATRTIDNFEGCVAQYPLRNGEEHRALVHFIRGRIDLHAGKIDDAIEHFEQTLMKRQWFGKIGTSQSDMLAATHISLAQALEQRINVRDSTLYSSPLEWIEAQKNNLIDYVRAQWMYRRARQILAEDLNDLEDITVRNTDSLIEYSTFGSLLSTFPATAIKRRIGKAQENDPRPEAQSFYKLYLQEANGISSQRSAVAVEELLGDMRPLYDDLLRLHALGRILSVTPINSNKYQLLANQIFKLNQAALRAYGGKLPVNYAGSDQEILEALGKGPFILDDSQDLGRKIDVSKSGSQIALTYESTVEPRRTVRVSGEDIEQTINKLADEIFVQQIRKKVN